MPNLLGPPLADGPAGFWAAPSFPWQRYYPSIFLGATPLLLAPWMLRQRRMLAPWLGMAALGVGGAVALGIPPVAAVVEGLPGSATVRYGIKLLVLLVLALPPLVSAGWQGLENGWSPRVRRAMVAGLAALALLALIPERWTRHALGLLYPASAASLQAQPSGRLGAAMRRDLVGLALPVAALAVAGPVPAVVAVAVALGGAVSGGTVLAWDDADRWAEPPAAARLAPPRGRVVSLCRHGHPADAPSTPELGRFWASRSVLYPEYGVRWGLRYALAPGPDGLAPWRAELLARLATALPAPDAARLGHALGADVVVSPEPIPGWRCEKVDGVVAAFRTKPRPRSVSGPPRAPGGEPPGRSPDAGERVVPPWPRRRGGGSRRRRGAPRWRGGGGARIAAPAALPGAGGAAPACSWSGRASWAGGGAVSTVRRFASLPANGCQVGVRVPSGQHRVELELSLTPYWIGGLGPLAVLGTRHRARRWRGAAGATDQSMEPSGGSMLGPLGCQRCSGA